MAVWLACAAALLVLAGARTGAGQLEEPQFPIWRLPSNGLAPRAPVTALAITADGTLLLGSEGGLFRSDSRGEQWEPLSAGLPPSDTVLAIAPAASDPDLIYTGLAGEGLYRSQDGGLNWKATGWTGHGTPAVLVDPRDSRHVFIRVAYERVYESRDIGETWASRWEGLGLSTQIISLAADADQPSIMYAGGTEGLFRSLNGAANWQNIGPELAGQTIFSIVVDPRNVRNLYVGATNGAYRSRDGGELWERWGLGLEDVTVTAVAFSRHDRGLVFAGTKYRGVFRSEDGGQHWRYLGPGPVSVNALLLTPDGRWLHAATTMGLHSMEVQAR